MKKRINSVAALVLCAAMLLSVLTGCGKKTVPDETGNTQQQTEATAAPQQNPEKEKLLEQWFELLKAYENVYSSLFQTMEYMEAFGRDNSWDSLLKARASTSATMVLIRQMELPALTLTEAEIGLLADAEVEINAVQREFENLGNWINNMDDTVTLIHYTLEEDVFLKAEAQESVPAKATFYREYHSLEYRFISLFTNYLLLQLDAADTWQTYLEQLPCMAACADMWYDDPTATEEASMGVLDEMEALQVQMGSFLGTSEFVLEILEEALQTGELDNLRREINLIDGVPAYFPIPRWLPDVLTLYMMPDADTQANRLVVAGEKLERAPSACCISCGAIALEDVQAYAEILEQVGIVTYGAWNDAKDEWQLLAKNGDSTVCINWTKNETTIYLKEPLGCLIPELYLYAMILE